MTYSKSTEEILKALNPLIVQARETAADARKQPLTAMDAAPFYGEFWDHIASRTDSMTSELQGLLSRITGLTEHPDELSNRFLLMQGMEDTALLAYATALQVGLTISRAQPAHREAFRSICGRYRALAQNWEVTADRVAGFYFELVRLIFSDMENNARQLLQKVIGQSQSAFAMLTDNADRSYPYLADEVAAITEALSDVPPGAAALSLLEDCKLRLEVVLLAADTDGLRTPSHKPLFDSLFALQESITEAFRFFAFLADTLSYTYEEPTGPTSLHRPSGTFPDRLKARFRILLFHLKGEVQKLQASYPDAAQKEAFDRICHGITGILSSMSAGIDDPSARQTDRQLREISDQLAVQSAMLGSRGAPIGYLARELLLLSDAM